MPTPRTSPTATQGPTAQQRPKPKVQCQCPSQPHDVDYATDINLALCITVES